VGEVKKFERTALTAKRAWTGQGGHRKPAGRLQWSSQRCQIQTQMEPVEKERRRRI
jgi:hypothetical protein